MTRTVALAAIAALAPACSGPSGSDAGMDARHVFVGDERGPWGDEPYVYPDAYSPDADLDSCVTPPPHGCRSDADCDVSRAQTCAPPGTPICTSCVRAFVVCSLGRYCPPTQWCETYVDPCSVANRCGNGIDVASTRCVPPCTAASCGPTRLCGAGGRCQPSPCDLWLPGSLHCPPHTTCRPLVSTGDENGCARDACIVDADCGCGGACVNSACYDAGGACVTPLP